MTVINATASTTLASICYQRLRREIRLGRFKPGERLRMQALTEEFEIGLSPMREALNRLAAEGFITQTDQRGFRVPPASVKELLELTRTRCAIGELTLRDSIAMGGPEWEEGLVVAHYRLSRVHQSHPDHVTHHSAFHKALISACPSRWLIDFSETLFDVAERYRALARNVADDTNLEELKKEHEDLFEAAINRDADTVLRIHNEHMKQSSNMILSTRRLFDEGLIEGEWSCPAGSIPLRKSSKNGPRLKVVPRKS